MENDIALMFLFVVCLIAIWVALWELNDDLKNR